MVHDKFKNILEQNGSKLFDTLIVLLKFFLKKLILKKMSKRLQKHEKLPSMQIVKGLPALWQYGNIDLVFYKY